MKTHAFKAALALAVFAATPASFADDEPLPAPFTNVELPEGRMLVSGDDTCPEGSELADGNGDRELMGLQRLIANGGRCPDMPIVRFSHGVTLRANSQNYCIVQARDTRTADLSYCAVIED